MSLTSFAETWRMTSLDWQPYTGRYLEDEGFVTKIVRDKLATKNIGLQVDFRPFDRAIGEVVTDRAVAMYPIWAVEDREGFIASKKIAESLLAAMHKSDRNIEWEDLDSLFKKYRVGYIKSYTYSDKVKSAIKKYPNKVDEAKNEMALMRALYYGRIDVALTDPRVMLYLVKVEKLDGIVAHEKIIEKKPLVILFKDDEEGRRKLTLFNELLD